MKTKLILALATASMLAGTATAKTIYGGEVPTSGWESPEGWGSDGGFGGFSDGAGGVAAGLGGDPSGGVIVICQKGSVFCDPQSPLTVLDTIYLGAPPQVGDANGGDPQPPPVLTDDQKQKCIADCNLARGLADNNCLISKDALRTKLTTDTSSGMFAVMPMLLKIFRNKRDPGEMQEWGNKAFGTTKDELDRKVQEFADKCSANAAASQNGCWINRCHAMLPFFGVLVLRRRRQEDDKA